MNKITYFHTFIEASTWAKRNPGKGFTRADDGIGFEVKNSTATGLSKPQQYQQSQQEIENYEFRQLVAEMSPLGFTHSKDVSSYIMRNNLGYKYKNISGIVKMAQDGREWKFKGGFPPDIYAQICESLGLTEKGSDAQVVGFKSFKNVDGQLH